MLLTQYSWAQRVVLLRPPAKDQILTEAFNRLRAELNLQLFEVVVIEPHGTDRIKSTADAASEQNGLAAVSLSQRDDNASAELCIVDRVTGKTTLRSLALDDMVDAPSVLAIRAVDLLRTSLREFEPAMTPAPEIRGVETSKPIESKKIRTWASPRRRASARLSAGMLQASSKVSPAYGIELAADYAILDEFRLGIWLMGPLIGARYQSLGGTASVRQEMAAARASVRLLQSGVFGFWTTVGFGMYHLDAHADVVSPLAARRDQVFSGLASLGFSGNFHVVGRLAFEVESNVMMLAPRPGIAVADSQTLFRQPVVTLSAGVRMDF